MTRPVVIFIHGLAMDKNIWLHPLETAILAGNIPLKYIAASPPEEGISPIKHFITTGVIPNRVSGLWSLLGKAGYNLICWSQKRPVQPIEAAVEELGEILGKVGSLFPQRSLVLIGHSRGGLIARKFMELRHPRIRALITIASPHAGSSLSRIGKHLSRLYGVIKSTLPQEPRGKVSHTFKRVQDLIFGSALQELMPGSAFFRELGDTPSEDISYLSFGGYCSDVLSIYKWERKDGIQRPRKLLTIPDSLLKFLPAGAVPEELKPGKGDFMVTAKSSKLPWTKNHYNLKANHFTILWHRVLIEKTLEILGRIS